MKVAAPFLVVALLSPALLAAAIRQQGANFILSGDTYTLTLSRGSGSIVSVGQKGETGSIVRSGEHGLWSVRFRDGSTAHAAAFGPDGPDRELTTSIEGDALELTYASDELVVGIRVTARAGGAELAGAVMPSRKVVLDFAVPARLRFDPSVLYRFISPANGNMSVGTAFKRSFFQAQPQDNPSAWRPSRVGPKGYVKLYGGPLAQRDDRDPPIRLTVTAEGRKWLGQATIGRVEGASAVVNRPPARANAEIVLVDSKNGPYFSANRLGGKGRLWRLGGAVGQKERAIAIGLVGGVIETLTAKPATRRLLGLVALSQGPPQGGWTDVQVREWLDTLQRRGAMLAGRAEARELRTVAEMLAALKGDEFLAILNPYGEWVPAPAKGGIDATVDAIGQYVRGGGNWFEVGGYPFYYALRPVLYYRYGGLYPAMFADFFHLDTSAGSASVYRVQPLLTEAWAPGADKGGLFVPGRLACGGDEQGGYCDRPFATYVKPGERWAAPAVRLTVGNSAEGGARAYAKANGIKRRLEDKMSADVLARFKGSVLVKYDGNARDKLDSLRLLPVPSQVHFSDYLKGGFDKEYPDHLPPHPHFGTAKELRAFFDECRKLGHLVMPYTNPTWWCDKPKGPTFQKHGDAPLLRTLDGKLSPERYAANVGFTVCHWHPAVQAANRATVRQFTEQYPVDILFQDQCGARSWRYDTNPASPTPYAYAHGLLAMLAEDSQKRPLSTESGWDRVVNYESQLCGLSWQIVPTEGGPSWRRLMKHDYAPATWEVFPLAQLIAHDKTAMLYHDLGQFVTNRQVLAWTLGLGFCMSYRIGAASLEHDAPRHWLLWLDRLQKSVAARYVGQPVRAFKHDRGSRPSLDDDGTIRAIYGPVSIVANLGPKPRLAEERELPPFGFLATAPGLIAANLKSLGDHDFGDEGVSFVTEARTLPEVANLREVDVWVYAPPEQKVAVQLPERMAGPIQFRLDGKTLPASIDERVLSFQLPARPGRKRVQPPPALAGKAPKDWPGEKPAIGVLDMVVKLRPVWTRIQPGQWLEAFTNSALHTRHGLAVRAIKTADELAAALKAGPTRWLAIINPYGEAFPAIDAARWKDTLDLVRRYVEHGGIWWETGGYSFYLAVTPGGESRHIGPSGLSYLGLPVGGGEVDQPPERLSVPAEGRRWLGDDLATRVARHHSSVNRGLLRGRHDPGHVALVAGRRQGFIGGYRLGGWGWLWRIGGFWPSPEVALPVAVAAVEHLYARPPLPVKPGTLRYLWHGVAKTGK